MSDAQQSDNQIRSLLTNAEIHFNRGEWDQADAYFDRVLEMNPQNKVALSGRRDVREKRERESEIQAKLKEGRDHLEELRFKEAIHTFNAAQDIGASHGILIYHAEIRTLRDRAQDSLTWRTAVDDGMAKARKLKEVGQTEPAIVVLRELLHSLTANGQNELAEPVRAELARLVQTREVEDQIHEAQQAFDEQDLERACVIAQELERRYEDRADVKRIAANFCQRWMMLSEQLRQAQTYLIDGKFEDALAIIVKVRGMVPNNPNWRALWLRAHTDQGHVLMARAQAALVQQDFSSASRLVAAATTAYASVLDVFPGHQPSERALAEMKAWRLLPPYMSQLRTEEILAEVRAHAMRGDWESALEKLNEARTLDFNPGEIEREVQRINRQRQTWVEIAKHQLDAEQKRATNSRLDAKRSYDEAILLASYPDSGLEPELRNALSDLRGHFNTMLDPYEFMRQGAELVSEARAKLDRIVRSGSKNPLAGRLSALAIDWYDISVAHARFGYVSSAEAIGSLEDAYAVAKEQLRDTPDDSEIMQKVIELRTKILEHLHGRVTNRITSADNNASQGRFDRALEDLESVEHIVAQIQARFPEIGDDETIQQPLKYAVIMITRITRLRNRAQQLVSLVEQINQAYVGRKLSEAERLINEAEVIDQERSVKYLWEQIDILQELIRRESYRNLQEAELSWQTAQERIAAEAWEDAFKALERGQVLVRGQMRENIQREIERIKPLAEIQRKRREAIENGKRSLSMRRFTDAIDNFASAIQLDAPRAEIQPYLAAAQVGEYLERAGAQMVTNPKEAERLLQDAIRLAGEAPPAQELRREAEAYLSAITQRLEHAANIAKMLQVAESALSKDQLQSASDALDEILQLDQGHPSAQNLKRKVNEAGRAQTLLAGATDLYEEKRYREAIELVEQSLAIYPLTAAQQLAAKLHAEQDAGEALTRAQSLAQEGRFVKARRELQSARDKNPNHPRLSVAQQMLMDMEEQLFVRVRRPIDDARQRQDYRQAVIASRFALETAEWGDRRGELQYLHQCIWDEWAKSTLIDIQSLFEIQQNIETNLEQSVIRAMEKIEEVMGSAESPADVVIDVNRRTLGAAMVRLQNLQELIKQWNTILPWRSKVASNLKDPIDARSFVQLIERQSLEEYLQHLSTILGISVLDLDFDLIWPVTMLDISPVLSHIEPANRKNTLVSTVPAIFLHPGCTRQTAFPELIRAALSVQSMHGTNLAFLFSFEESQEDLRHVREQIVFSVREAEREAVVFFRDDIVRILAAEDPLRQLQIFILSQIDIERVSPYSPSVGRTPDRVFVGREFEIRAVAETCINGSSAVIGGRRIGKTSLLHRLHRHYLPLIGLYSVYYDCAAAQNYDYQRFMSLHLAERDWSPEMPADAPRTFGQLLEFRRTGRPIIVLLDEADRLVTNDRTETELLWPLFNTLRVASNAGSIQFVFGGERALRSAVLDSTSPLFNFVNVHFLGPLTKPAVEQLVLGPMRKLEIRFVQESEITNRIFDFTSGHPNVIQYFCARLIERLNRLGKRQLDLDDVEKTLSEPQFVRNEFLGTYFASATVLEHIVALEMAQHSELTTLSSLHTFLNAEGIQTTLNQVDDVMERLVDLRNILRRTPDGYEFAVSAFPLLMARQPRIKDLVNLRVEIYRLLGDILPEHAPVDNQGRLW